MNNIRTVLSVLFSSFLIVMVVFSQLQGHPIFKRVSGLSEPVVVKSQEVQDSIDISSILPLYLFHIIGQLFSFRPGYLIMNSSQHFVSVLTSLFFRFTP